MLCDIFRDVFEHEVLFANRDFTAVYNTETDEGVIVHIDLPGCARGDVDVSIDDDIVTVKAKRRGRDVCQRLRLRRDLDYESLSANLIDGVLSLSVKKLGSAKRRTIEVTCNVV